MTTYLRAISPTTQAILLMIIAVFAFTALDAVAKHLVQDHHTLQVVWARYFFQVLWAVILLGSRLRTLMKTKYMGMQLLRSSFLFGATMFFFFGLNWMTLSDITAIFEVAPLLITAFAFIFLKEKVGPRRWFGVIIGMIGAMIIIRPGSEVFSLTSLIPMAAAACYAAYAISTRVLGQEESPWTSFLYTALIGTIIASCFVPLYWTQPTPTAIGFMILMGLIASIGHYCLILAFRLSEASFLAPFGYLSLLFSTAWGFFLFYELPTIYTIIGGTIIAGSGLYVWYRENQTDGTVINEASALPK